MNLKDMSEVDIISLQYSLLEEIKQKQTSTPKTQSDSVWLTSSQNVDKFLSQPFKNERKSESTSVRMTPSAKEILDNSKYSYGDAIEYFAFKVLNNSEEFIDDSEVERNSKEYNRYHERVLKRDKVCQCCGKSEDLEVHHPMPFNQYNSLGADTNNGIVLCKECHSKYHSEYGYKKNANAVTLALFLRDYGLNPQQSFEDIDLIEKEVNGGVALPDILKNIREYQQDHKGYCPIKYLLDGFEEFGFDRQKIQEQIDYLVQKGEVYLPKKGYVGAVDGGL